MCFPSYRPSSTSWKITSDKYPPKPWRITLTLYIRYATFYIHLRFAYIRYSQLLEETLDAGGHPSTTSPNALKDIVLPPSLLHKVLSVAGVSGLASPGMNTHPFASPIPWRKTGVRYNNNEIYFDIVERLKAIVNKWVARIYVSNRFIRTSCLLNLHTSFEIVGMEHPPLVPFVDVLKQTASYLVRINQSKWSIAKLHLVESQGPPTSCCLLPTHNR